jgi:hypothetical protein
MPDEKISFPCPACGINLNVPATLAGVTGPCPSCKATIQAPCAAPAAPKEVILKNAVADAKPAPKLPSPTSLAKPQTTGPVATDLTKESTPETVSRSYTLFIISAIALIAAIVFLTLVISKKQSPPETPPKKNQVVVPAATAKPSLPPIEEPEGKLASISPSTPIPKVKNSPAQPMTAREVLDQFLTARSIEERRPILETQTPESELANSCLAAPLPPAAQIEIESKNTNSSEQIVDTYYAVDFSEKATTILVRKRANQEPKIVVDPFLDTYGGRLASFAKAPSDESNTFQAIISPVASCNDERVPNSREKLTLKILARDNIKEITQAYFTKNSPIAKLLEDGSYHLSYGKAKPCTITLRWNREENPETPFLEALEVKALNWNP